MTTVAFVFFWASIALIVYTYAGFTVLLALRARFFPKPVQRGAETPSVSLIIAAYNEADVIADKIANCLGLDYPQDKIEIIVASDGSSDGTNEIVSGIESPLVKFMPLPRQGKNRTVNTAVPAATGDILVFSDADSMLGKDALRHLVAPFADPNVGGVGGDYRYDTEVAEGDGERTYWGFDRILKHWQSEGGSMTSATGQIYAIRRELFSPVPSSVTDDFYNSTQAPAAHKRLIFEPRAVARGPVAGSSASEYRRKVRIITRGFNSVWQMRRMLNPLQYGFYAIQLFTHKILRRLAAVPLIAILIATPFLWDSGWLYKLALLGQIGLYGGAVAGLVLRNTKLGNNKLVSLPLFFCMVNAAGLVAFFNLLRGKRYDVWTAERAETPQQA